MTSTVGPGDHPHTGRLVTFRTWEPDTEFGLTSGMQLRVIGWITSHAEMLQPNLVEDPAVSEYTFRTGGRLPTAKTVIVEDRSRKRHLVEDGEIVRIPDVASIHMDGSATSVEEAFSYEWKPRPGYSLILRTSVYAREEAGLGHTRRVVSSFTRSHPVDRQFVWPTTPGSVVEASDFTIDPACGHGLHGLEWGRGMRIMLEDEHNPDAVYQVLDVADEDIVRIGNRGTFLGPKVKFRKGTLVYSGDFDGAAKIVADNTPKDPEAEKAIADLSAHKHRFYAMGPSGDKRLSYGEIGEPGRVETDNPSGADLISSEIATAPGYHTIALDIDYHASVVPSGTPGRHHLYLDRMIDWATYETLLKALADAGVIEPGYAAASIRRKATFLRTPHRPKGS